MWLLCEKTSALLMREDIAHEIPRFDEFFPDFAWMSRMKKLGLSDLGCKPQFYMPCRVSTPRAEHFIFVSRRYCSIVEIASYALFSISLHSGSDPS